MRISDWVQTCALPICNTAENVAKQWQITREEQDAFAAASQNKAEAAQKGGRFKDEIVPVTIKTRKGETVVDADEYPRNGVTAESLAGLRPAFDKEGSVTPGNRSDERRVGKERVSTYRYRWAP